jgi:hypothetical protein
MNFIHLMNSAMMPAPGTYTLRAISQHEFTSLIEYAAMRDKLVSWIGYPENAQFIFEITGIKVRVTRDVTRIAKGDELLIMKLKYRTTGLKGSAVNPEDFEYFHASYQ